MEASYAIIRIIKTYPKIRLAAGVSNEAVGAEKQSYTIGLYPSEGVEVELYQSLLLQYSNTNSSICNSNICAFQLRSVYYLLVGEMRELSNQEQNVNIGQSPADSGLSTMSHWLCLDKTILIPDWRSLVQTSCYLSLWPKVFRITPAMHVSGPATAQPCPTKTKT